MGRGQGFFVLHNYDAVSLTWIMYTRIVFILIDFRLRGGRALARPPFLIHLGHKLIQRVTLGVSQGLPFVLDIEKLIRVTLCVWISSFEFFYILIYSIATSEPDMTRRRGGQEYSSASASY